MKKIIRATIQLILLSILLTACSKKTPEEHITAAKSFISAHEIDSAIIEVKSAIQQSPKDSEIRLLLAQLYNKNGEAIPAEKEFLKAIQLGAQDDDILVGLLQAMRMQSKFAEIITYIDKNEPFKPTVFIVANVYKSIAYYELGDKKSASETLNDISETTDDNEYSILAKAYGNVFANKSNIALNEIDNLLKEQPDFTEALFLKGQLSLLNGNYSNSVSAFKQYLELLPRANHIRIYLANALVKNQQFDEAKEHLDFLLTIVPNHSFSNYLKAIIANKEGKFEQSNKLVTIAIQNGLDNIGTRSLAAVTAFREGLIEQSYNHLIIIQNDLPNDHLLTRLYAYVQLQLGYITDTSKTLGNMENISEEDISLYTATSFELIKSGNTKEAKELLNISSKIKTKNTQVMTQRGLLKLTLRDIDGLHDLEAAIELDPKFNTAKLALATTYIGMQEFSKAIEVAKQWQEEDPKNIAPFNLEAHIYIKEGNAEKAEKALEKASNIDPNNLLSQMFQVQKAIYSKNYTIAAEKLEFILTTFPRNFAVLSKYLSVKSKQNELDPALLAIENALKGTRNVYLDILYAKGLLKDKQATQAIEILSTISTNDTTPDHYWLLLSYAHRLNKDKQAEVNTYDNWAKKKIGTRSAYFAKAISHELQGNIIDANKTIEAWLNNNDKDYEFIMINAYYLVNIGHYAAANKIITSLPKPLLTFPQILQLRGILALENNNAANAQILLERSYQQAPKSKTAMYLSRAIEKNESVDSAIIFLTEKIKEQPKNSLMQMGLAELLLKKDKKSAITAYKKETIINPKNAAAFNNLAWLNMEQGYLNDAESYAEKAFQLINDNPDILDTLGYIKIKLNKISEAVTILKKGYDIAPQHGDIAIHYAQALIANKQTLLAKKVLSSVNVTDKRIMKEVKNMQSKLN